MSSPFFCFLLRSEAILNPFLFICTSCFVLQTTWSYELWGYVFLFCSSERLSRVRKAKELAPALGFQSGRRCVGFHYERGKTNLLVRRTW